MATDDNEANVLEWCRVAGPGGWEAGPTLLTVTTDLADRYGTPSRWRRPAAVSLAVVLAVVGLGWLGWTVWFHTNPAVTSELVSFEVTSDHETQVRLDVRLGDVLRGGGGALARLVVGVGVDVHESETGARLVCGGSGHGEKSRSSHLRF